MTSYYSYNPSKRMSEWAAALLSPYIKLESEDEEEASTAPSPSLSVGLWSGNVELQNVAIRPDAIERFLNNTNRDDDVGDPIDGGNNCSTTSQIKWKLRRGNIDSVKIQIPWKSLLVGSAFSSSNKSTGNPEDGSSKATRRADDESASGMLSTTIQIEGVSIQLGYEIVHHDRLLISLQDEQNNDFDPSSFENVEQLTDNDHLRAKIRQEKNRILQIAERRLLAGMDPFPPQLMEELHSILNSTIHSDAAASLLQPTHHATTNDDNASAASGRSPYTLDTTTSTATSTYLSRIENYMSSTIKSLLWRIVDSISVSVTQVQLSIVGCSHYDKDHASLLKKESTTKKKSGGDSSEGNENPQRKQHDQSQQQEQYTKSLKQSNSKQDLLRRRRWNDENPSHRNFNQTPFRRSLSAVGQGEEQHSDFRQSSFRRSLSAVEQNEEQREQSNVDQEKSINEDPSIWSREGQIEVGISLDRLDVKPGPDAQSDSAVLKKLRLRGWGVYIRRTHLEDITAPCDDAIGVIGEHTGRKLVWKVTNNEDFVLMPMTINASCRVYRKVSGSVGVGLVSPISSPSRIDDELSTIGSKATMTTKRRGKRDKRQTLNPIIRGPLHAVSSTTPSTESLDTIGNAKFDRGSSPHRLDVSIEIGHVRCSFSPRQIFLFHSLLSSMTRMRRGRPQKTIHSARAHDRALIESMPEEGKMMLWKERMYREVLSLRPRSTTRTIPGVVISWWKYAFFNVVNEIRHRRRLLSRCRGESNSTMRRKESTFVTRQNFVFQSRIRREYIDLYLAAYRPIGDTSSSDEAKEALEARFRLAKMEDVLPIERLLLLKSIARAASGQHTHTEDHSSPADIDFIFSPNSQSFDSMHWSEQKREEMNDAGNSLVSIKKCESVHLLHDINMTGTPLTFSGTLAISGISLEICDFRDRATHQFDAWDNVDDISDDISTLTGFSEGVPKTIKHTRIGDTFDPFIQLGSAQRHGFNCEQIMVMHIAGISLSSRRLIMDAFQSSTDFSIDGISLQMACVQAQQNLLHIGRIPESDGESAINLGTSKSESDGESSISLDTSNYSKFVSGGLSSSTNSIIVGPAEFIVDWGWIERIVKFASTNTDVMPVRTTPALEYEDLLVKSFLNHSTKRVGGHATLSLKCDAISLTLPLQNVVADNRIDQKFIIVTAICFHVETVTAVAPTSEVYEESIIHTPYNQDMLFVLSGLDTIILTRTQKEDLVEMPRMSTPFFRSPINVQLQYSSGEGSYSYDQPRYTCSYDVRSPTIHLLVSEARLRSLMIMVETITMSLGISTVVDSDLYETPGLMIPALTDFALTETKLSIQSFGIHVVTDESEEHSDDLSARAQLEDAIASFLTQLSYLDFEHPSQVANACLSKLFIDRASTLGISEEEARQCLETAKALFLEEARAKCFSSSMHADAKNGPLGLSEALDQVVLNSTRMTTAKFGDGLPNIMKEEFELVVESLLVSKSFLYYGSASQLTIKSLKIRNQHVTFLKILHESSNIQPIQPVVDPDESALTITIQDRIIVNRGRDIYFEIGKVETTFSPEDVLEVAATCGKILETVSGRKNDHHPETPVKNMIVNGSLSSLTIVLTDKLLPFIECRLHDVVYVKSDQKNHTATQTIMHAGAISLECVIESSYPKIISTYTKEIAGGVNEQSAFFIQLTTRESFPNEISIEFNGVRIVFLQQIINELLQYISSPTYGIGLFLNRFVTERESDGSGEPSKFNVLMYNSSIILPRDSKSIDMIGIEVKEVSITQEQAAETWVIDNPSFSNVAPSKVPDKRVKIAASIFSSDIFFDCIDDKQSSTNISRFAIDVKGAQVFTALNPCHVSTREIDMAAFNANVFSTGRIVHNKLPFVIVGKVNKALRDDLTLRVWEEINEPPLSLKITLDCVPYLRLLVEDVDDGGAHFSLRMSQFYLAMSIWFSNMQELPILFPYDIDFLEKLSKDPTFPSNWPQYGTSEFVTRLKKCDSDVDRTFEMALCFKNLTWQCLFDNPDYFAAVPPNTSSMQLLVNESERGNDKNFISIVLMNVICRIDLDKDNLQRIGVAASSVELLDGRQRENAASYKKGLFVEGDNSQPSNIDLNWGLDCGRHTLLAAGLPMPFQVTVIMTPDMNYLINLGMSSVDSVLADLTPIWIILDYFGRYFTSAEYGHPARQADIMYGNAFGQSSELNDNVINLDFRMWMLRPHVIIPSSADICIMLEAEGLYYRYKSFGQKCTSQEIIARELAIVTLAECMSPSTSRDLRQVSGSLGSSGAKTLIEDMSFSLSYEFNASDTTTNGTPKAPFVKVALRMPLIPQHFDPRSMDGIECSSIDPQPFVAPPPVVCKPFIVPSRDMGHRETSIYLSHEYMKLMVDLMTTFVGQGQDTDSMTDDNTFQDDDLSPGNLFSVVAHIEQVKFVLSDPIMGMHHPILSVCFPSLLLTASQLEQILQDSTAITEISSDGTGKFNNASDMQVSVEATAFIDYFKLGLMTRNWEEFVEPFKCLILYERSASRGMGITFNADCPLHLNVSSASIETLDDAIKSFYLLQSGSLIQHPKKHPISDNERFSTVSAADEWGRKVTVLHQAAEQLGENERVAFSLENRTGELLRIHTHSPLETDTTNSQATVVYLNHLNIMPLNFPATETAIKNLQSVEVPFKGDKNNKTHYHELTSHEIDFQIPAFRWVRAVSFDKTGKCFFLQLIPRSPIVESKIVEDWRLRNALHVLTDIKSVTGGRRLSISSPFQVINKTGHPLLLATHPDPRHLPDPHQDSEQKGFPVSKINTDESHCISFVLIESALRLSGNHLGSLWIRPDQSSTDEFNTADFDPNSSVLKSSSVGFPHRPIQLAKILHESSIIFKDNNGDPDAANQVASGIEISCSVFDKLNQNPLPTPFCYIVEVQRSPFARSSHVNISPPEISSPPTRIGKGLKTPKKLFGKSAPDAKPDIHAPIAYSLVIHPPLIIENLLPERGRFELMHAISGILLWSGVLVAGERCPIFTVGLDAPLFLHVNLGYCRSAVGEGALVHHGGGDGLFKPWNVFHGAMKTSRDRVKRALNTIAETKDSRGIHRLAGIHTNQIQKDKVSSRRFKQLGSNTENDINPNLLKRGNVYGMEDIATELSAVDSLGQRLTLQIENVLGSGGQRQITLYSPFWIVNTTEHSLQYKQDKSPFFVAGTVLSKSMDGSKPVDEGHRSFLEIVEGDSSSNSVSTLDSLNATIFSGKPGAMALLKRNMNCPTDPALIAALISNDLPLRIVSNIAFMFNYQDVLTLRGLPRLCIQLIDTQHDTSQYTSAWSSAFGLESVGVTQIVGMHCKDGRGLEVGVSISVAPGRLASYTKIVRICPRYVVVNQLPFPIRIWQDSSLHHPNVSVDSSISQKSQKWIFAKSETSTNEYEQLFGSPAIIDPDDESGMVAQTNAHKDACFIATVRPLELVAFHLPDTKLERSLRVDFGPSWCLSPSIAADIPAEYVLVMNRVRDLRLLPHVSSRGAPVYTVMLFPTDNHDWNGELGVFFETEWGRERKLIVKGIKEGSYASYFTDIAVGDEMIMIDSTPVRTLTFDDAMKYMKARLVTAKEAGTSSSPTMPLQLMMNKKKKRIHKTNAEISSDNTVTLTFLTLEERLRRLRRAAVGQTKERINDVVHNDRVEWYKQESESPKEVLVDMKFLFQSIFVFLRTSSTADPPYRITNRSLHWRIYYRQRACDSHPWKCLSPGESSNYTWEEPMKAKKLSVRVGAGEWIDSKIGGQTIDFPVFSFQFVQSEEQGHFGPVKTVKLEEIGYIDKLPCPLRGHDLSDMSGGLCSSLICEVDTEGSTRVLYISDDEMVGNQQGLHLSDEALMRCHLESIKKNISDEKKRRAKIDKIKRTVTSIVHSDGSSGPPKLTEEDSATVEVELQDFMDYDEGHYITKRNQVMIEVMEATGLRSSDLNGFSNPFVQVKLICRNKRRRIGSFGTRNPTRCTYFVEKTLSPQWCDQSFIFDVPERAAYDPKETRRYSIQCVIKSVPTSIAAFPGNKFLGQAHVHLRNVKDQKENVGWYPLMGKLGESGIGKDPLDRVCGSIRLRVQWVNDIPGLLEYYILCTDRRLSTLDSAREGMKRQLKALHDLAKEEKELEESVSIARVPALAAIRKKTDDERSSHHSKLIMGVRQLIEKRKRATNVKTKNRILVSSLMDSMLEESSDSSRDYEDSSVSNESPIDFVSSSPRSEYPFHVGEAGTMTPSSPVDAISSAETFSHSQIENARHVSLRWRNYTDKSISSFSYVYPLYPSLNISRLFANPAMKSKRSNLTSPTINLREKKESAVSLFELRKLLPSVPHLFVEREKKYLLDLIESRTLFSKAAKRSLDSIFNPGGTLTIRPLTALNLPNSYAGMFVKVRYDNRVQSTVSVDSKVTPVWSKEQDINQQQSSSPMKRGANTQIRKRGINPDDLIHNFRDIAEICNPRRTGGSREYEINIQISPFETSKSLRLSVIGELHHAPNVEIGVLDIPLGPALECTTDEAVYIRWFPLKSPTEAIPIEGDMNASCRPVDSEKLSDGLFSEYNPPCVKLALMFRPNSVETETDNVAAGTESSNRSKANQYLYLRINQISASLIDSNRTIELALLSARDADVRYSVTTAKTRLAVAVGNIQLDHQSYDLSSQAPVILAPTPVKCPEPTVQFLAWKDNIRSKSDLDSYEYVACQVQELDLKIEESWLCDVWRLYCDVAKTRKAKAALQHINRSNISNAFEFEQTIDPIAKASLFLKEDVKVNRKRIYIRELTLGFFKLNLSYFKSLRSTKGNLDLAGNILSNIDGSELRRLHIPLEMPDRHSTGSDEAYLQWSENHFEGVDERAPYRNILSSVLPRISDAPISFNERVIYHVYETEGEIWKSLRSFYSAESLRQIYKIVGSLDFVGNPTMVLTSFRTGLRDFILQPSRELKSKNPSRVGVGVLKGTLSLVSNSASGIFGFASNLGSTFGETAIQLTLDEHFQRLHYEQKAAKQRHYDRWKQKGFGQVSLMVSRPVSDIVFSVISASTGLVVEPYRGAKEDGLVGFTKGSVIGIIGVVVKPIVGLSDAFSHVTESIHDIAKSVNLLELRSNAIVRYRLPSVFGPQKMLLPFNPVASRSAQLIKAHPLEKKTKMCDEVIIASEALNRGSGFEHYLVVTTFRVILFGLKVVDGQGFVTTSLIWQVRFDKLARITSNLGNKGHNGFILYISRYSSLTHEKSSNWDELSQHKSNLGDSTKTLNQTIQYERDNLDGKNVSFGFLRTFASTEDVDCHRFTVEGEVKHRVQLSRIHNAICCICGDFNSVVREIYHTNGEEGITLFRPYSFEQISPGNKRADRSFLYAELERTVWKCESSLFSITNLDNRPSWACEEAESQTSLENVNREFSAVVDEDFVLHSRLDCNSIDVSVGSSEIEDASTSDQDSFLESFRTFPFLSRQSSPVCEVDEFVPPSNVQIPSYPPSVDANSTSNLSERVRRVEALLENLVRRDSSAAGETAPGSATDYDPHRLDSTSMSPLSCTPSGNVDVRVLMREIEDLKQQLSAKMMQ